MLTLVHYYVNLYYSFEILDYRPVKIETATGTELSDWSAKPPDTVYVVGVKDQKK
jgi:hypothetical protein